MRRFARYPIVFLLLVLAACLLLLAAGLIPQEAMEEYLAYSMDQLVSEGWSPGVLYTGHPRSTLDNYSEMQILLRSYYMDTRASAAAIFNNPGWKTPEGTPSEHDQLGDYAAAFLRGEPANSNYARYWMGFRVIVRPLLALGNYMDARQCILWAFCLLLGAVTLQLYRRTGSFWIALAFVFAISQLNPMAIAGCFQFSLCFMVAFVGMLLVLSLRFCRITEPLLFFILGAATQYFDFYTVPVLCFGLPMLALLLRRQYEPAARFTFGESAKRIGLCLAAWFAAYVAMWLAKLALTSLFTPQNAFLEAFSRLWVWIMEPNTGTSHLSAIPLALFTCAINMVDRIPLLLEAAAFLLWLVFMLRRRPPCRVLIENLAYLIIALLPILWIAIASKPSYNHAYFQYRGLGVTLYAGCLFLLNTVRKVSPAPPESEGASPCPPQA